MHLLKDNSVQKNQNDEAGTLCIGQPIGSALLPIGGPFCVGVHQCQLAFSPAHS